MIKTCWTGCSFTWGEGFCERDREIYVYDRVVSKAMSWQHHNMAQRGASNHVIFLSAAQSLLSGQFDKVFVQWTALNRIWLFPGPDTQFFLNDDQHPDYVYRDLYITPKDKKKLRNLLLLLNHDYHNILQLVDYCRILESISKQKQCDVYFINGLVPWTSDINDVIIDNFSTHLSSYTKQIIDFDYRDDNEIMCFLNRLHNKFSDMPKYLWINLFDSMHDCCVDTGPLGHHPGIQSHKQMADKIIAFFEKLEGIKNA